MKIYSRTSTNSHLSATVTFFIPMDANSYINLSTTATSPQQQLILKRFPPAKVTSPHRHNGQLINNGRTVSIKLYFLLEMVAKLDPNPARVVGLYFCLASLLLIYFDCVTYLHVTLSTFFTTKLLNPMKTSVSCFTLTDTSPYNGQFPLSPR